MTRKATGRCRSRVALLLLSVCVAASTLARAQTSSPAPAATTPASAPSEPARARATENHKAAIERLRDAAKAAQAGDAASFSKAVTDTAGHIRVLLDTATWLPAFDRDMLGKTAAGLDARARQGPGGYSPDADLAALDSVGARVRSGATVEVVFEGSFARSQPKEPVQGGHATAMAPPAGHAPAAGHATAAPPPAGHATAQQPPPAGHATAQQPPPAGHATAAQPPAGHATAAPPPAGHATAAQPPPAGHATAAPPPAGHATAQPPPAGQPPAAGHATAQQPPPAGHATAQPPPPAGHATAQPPPAGHATAAQPAPAVNATAVTPVAASAASHGIRFDLVRGQLTEKTYGGGLSKLHLLESGGNGVALFDYDGDGLLDIYTVSAFDLDEKNGRARIPHRNALYRNLGGMKFRNVAAEAGVDAAAWGYGVCAGDYDEDGRLDLYVTNYGPNLLYRNSGNGRFEEVAAKAGVAASGWSTGCAFLDADGDGDLDLYVARYVTAPEAEVANPERFLVWRGVAKVMLGPTGLPGAGDVFFENKGGGRFVEATDAWSLTDRTSAYGFGVVATDYDNDGWTDIFVANDSNPNFLYRNLAGKGFESAGLVAGVAVNADGRAQAGMGADSGDFDGDGRMDLALTTFAFDFNSLYRNAGDGAFEDVSRNAGFVETTFEDMSWGVSFLDADLDGDLDLYVANGHLFPQVDEYPGLGESYGQRDRIFLNDGGRFHDVSATAGRGLTPRKPSRGLAVGDLDNDGDPDLVVSAMDEEPLLLENTQQSGRRWVGIGVKHAGPNAFAIGARVSVECGETKQVREVRSGGGYLSQNDLRALFGLGTCAGPVTVDVRLGQKRWRFPGVAVDRHVSLVLDASHAVVP